MAITREMKKSFDRLVAESAYVETVTMLMCFQHGLRELHSKGDGPFRRRDLIEAFGGLPLEQLADKIAEIPVIRELHGGASWLTVDKAKLTMEEQGHIEQRRREKGVADSEDMACESKP